MKISEIRPIEKTSFCIFAYIITFITWFFFPSIYALCQERPRVNIFEFNLESRDSSDSSLKELIQRKLINKLSESDKIEKPEFVSNRLLKSMGDKNDYLKQEGIQYTIDGTLESLPKDRMRIIIELADRKIEDNANKGVLWNKPKILKKELADLEFWFDRVTHYIFSIIEGVPITKVVFTNCFETSEDEDSIISHLKLLLPIELKEKLEDSGLGSNYKIVSFGGLRETQFKCEKESPTDRSLEIYEYVISGDIAHNQESEKLDVTVVVTMTEDQSKKFIRGFSERGNSPRFAEKLAEYIIKEWPDIIKRH